MVSFVWCYAANIMFQFLVCGVLDHVTPVILNKKLEKQASRPGNYLPMSKLHNVVNKFRLIYLKLN